MSSPKPLSKQIREGLIKEHSIVDLNKYVIRGQGDLFMKEGFDINDHVIVGYDSRDHPVSLNELRKGSHKVEVQTKLRAFIRNNDNLVTL
jgi:hypothetical protein